jgi:DNA helicase HerA-like ATPase
LSRDAFERISKEGRKFGLSLIIASQRPSDVSATVLSQCANFLIHRIQNPEDIDYFKKILPLGSRDLLEQLPILAPGEGLLMGSAVNVPTRLKVRKPIPSPESETSRPWESWQDGQPEFDRTEALNRWVSEAAPAPPPPPADALTEAINDTTQDEWEAGDEDVPF